MSDVDVVTERFRAQSHDGKGNNVSCVGAVNIREDVIYEWNAYEDEKMFICAVFFSFVIIVYFKL